jgi:hypothetical protein
MSAPQLGHTRGNSSPTRAISFAKAIRDVSCEDRVILLASAWSFGWDSIAEQAIDLQPVG